MTLSAIRSVKPAMNTAPLPVVRAAWAGSIRSLSAMPAASAASPGLSLNSLDVMTGLETVKICTGYKYRGEIIEHYPASLKALARVRSCL